MLKEKNILRLKEHLLSLGLAKEIERDLRINICLQPDYFTIRNEQVKDTDTMTSVFYFDKKEEEFHCLYYESCLRKNIVITDGDLYEIDVKDLQERMTVINWKTFFHKETTDLSQRSWEKEESIEGIITDLKKLSGTPEGFQIAERLKIKFWMDTPLESYIPNVNSLRHQYEISQRFYFFEGETLINLDEAYRFLCHRWREKQLNASKKQKGTDGSENNSAGAKPKGKVLLKKNKASKPKESR